MCANAENTTNVMRPNQQWFSFRGNTAQAFMAASFMSKEFGAFSTVWCAYTMATSAGVFRVLKINIGYRCWPSWLLHPSTNIVLCHASASVGQTTKLNSCQPIWTQPGVYMALKTWEPAIRNRSLLTVSDCAINRPAFLRWRIKRAFTIFN